MGRFAQQRKRGGHVGVDAGLPAGPTEDLWILQAAGSICWALWLSGYTGSFGFVNSRWRVPSISMVWTESLDGPVATDSEQLLYSPFVYAPGTQQDCELRYQDEAGNPLSQWSAWKSIGI